ncbi:unnamed protein product, partial [Mesorhabditis belari]|uniref:C2H2-type domain-containing protein n=1 Tax=Mesorhabditis belari TaxID=2138241 RepID=A0AAF3EV37_9BILA
MPLRRRFCLVPTCNYSTYDGSNYKKHLLKHGFHAPASNRKKADPNSDFYCERCNAPFVNPESLRVHNRTKHEKQGQPKLSITCNKCNECFHRQDIFSEHYFLEHMGENESPVIERDFESIDAFEEWINDLQKTTKCEMKKRTSHVKKYLHYRCAQAGKKVDLKYKTAKADMRRVAYCTAFVNATVTDRETVNAIICERHNHTIDVKKPRKRVIESDEEEEYVEATGSEDSDGSDQPGPSSSRRCKNANSEASFVCSECSEKFITRDQLYRHRRLKHSTNHGAIYLCQICKSSLTTEKAFCNHVNECHPVVKSAEDKFLCPVERCSFKAREKEEVVTHLCHSHSRKITRKRLTVNNVLCDKCPAAFPTLEHFYKHFFEAHFNKTYGNFVEKSFLTRAEFRSWVGGLIPNTYSQIYYDFDGGEKCVYHRCNGKADTADDVTRSRACSSFINAIYNVDGSMKVKYFPDHNHTFKQPPSLRNGNNDQTLFASNKPTISRNDYDASKPRGWWNKKFGTREYFFSILELEDDEVKDPMELLSLPNLSCKELDKHVFAPHQLQSVLPLLDFNECLDVCLKFLAKYKLISNTRRCKNCFRLKTLFRDTVDCYRWTCEECWKDPRIDNKGIRETMRAQTVFENEFLNLRSMVRLLGAWCENPGEDRTKLGQLFRTTPQMVFNIQKKFATATKRWYMRHKEEEKEREQELQNKVKQEVVDPEEYSGAMDVTSLLGGPSSGIKQEIIEDCFAKINNIKQEAEKEPEPDLFLTVFKTNKSELIEKYKVIGPFPEVFVYDFLMRKHFGEEKLMNRFLYEITQLWDVDAEQPTSQRAAEIPLIQTFPSIPLNLQASSGHPHLVMPKVEPLAKVPKLEL